MLSLQWLKLLLPIIGEYIKEFIIPTAAENKTTRGERIVALIIAVLVLCLTSIIDKSVTLNKEASKAKLELVEANRKVKERDTLIENIKFYLDRCDGKVAAVTDKLLQDSTPYPPPVSQTQESSTTVTVEAPKRPEPAKVTKPSPEYSKVLLDLISNEDP